MEEEQSILISQIWLGEGNSNSHEQSSATAPIPTIHLDACNEMISTSLHVNCLGMDCYSYNQLRKCLGNEDREAQGGGRRSPGTP